MKENLTLTILLLIHACFIQCQIEEFRNINGTGNNIENPAWGAHNSEFIRLLPPQYGPNQGILVHFNKNKNQSTQN